MLWFNVRISLKHRNVQTSEAAPMMMPSTRLRRHAYQMMSGSTMRMTSSFTSRQRTIDTMNNRVRSSIAAYSA